MSVGHRIKELRMLHELSLEELGRLSGGIPAATISRYENNKTRPRVEYLLAIAAALKANPQYIIDGTLPKSIKDLSGGMKELIAACSELNPDALAMVIAAAKALKK